MSIALYRNYSILISEEDILTKQSQPEPHPLIK